ncbi:hypothetical protein FKG94_07030 [Exilibacterium tricleocarpae]|uniref:Uncharacterized protein n=1 Tax=Exilibacterium tricleocarpae TaxID=2591008 RepID=A0A545TZ72_9GAMM|nr:hypothetical protein [Exilibacterium tricleocarpae]TQV82487.1 hypothetical protein FKG94_07030 [Exilibacterium tricleocarpae]
MSSGFLTNLIGRHQAGGDALSGDVAATVQPRPQGRFEAERSGLTTDCADTIESQGAAGESVVDSAAGAAVRLGPFVQDEVSREHGTETDRNPPRQDSVGPDDHSRLEDINKRISAISAALGQSDASREVRPVAIDDQVSRQPPDLSSHIEHESSDQHFLKENGLHARIEEILQSLSNHRVPERGNSGEDRQAPADISREREISPLQQTSAQPAAGLSAPGDVVNPRTDLVSLNKAPEPAPDRRASNPDFPKQRADNHDSGSGVFQEKGMLDTPDWVTRLREDLGRQVRDLNPPAASEPVVNVTIGRVDVRAVQTETGKATASKRKPTGVMSLDDYLKHREQGDKA